MYRPLLLLLLLGTPGLVLAQTPHTHTHPTARLEVSSAADFALDRARPMPDGVGLVLDGPFTFCVLEHDPEQTVYGPPSLAAPALRAGAPAKAQTATFQVTYTGFTPEAQAAFQSAVDLWATHIVSSVPIRVEASFVPLGTNVLGSAGATQVYANRPQFPLQNTWYPNAIADALVGQDLNPNVPDIRAQFSSNFPNFYFGLDGNPPVGRIDFRSVVLHELGHGLGFFGTADVTSGIGSWGLGQAGLPLAYDRLVRDAALRPMLDLSFYPNNSVELANLLQSNALFLDTPGLRNANAGSPPRIYAPAVWNQGSSYSHWDEASFPAGTPNALMTPFIGARTATGPLDVYVSPGPLTCALFAELGWGLGASCLAQVSAEEEAVAAEGLGLRLVGPNPFAGQTRVSLTAAAGQDVRVALFDALGREVARVADGPVATGNTFLEVRAAGLAPGVYVLRAEGARGVAALSLVVAR